MTYALEVSDAYGQPFLSTNWKSLVFGGSTKHTGTEKVSTAGTIHYGSFNDGVTGYGGFIDFRIEDSTLTSTDDSAVTETILPFFSGPVPIAASHVYKCARSGGVNIFFQDSFVSNAGNNESSVRGFTSTGMNASNELQSTHEAGLFARADPGHTSNSDLPGAGTITMARRNKMIPHLFVGDQFQFGPRTNVGGYWYQTQAGYESITYKGSGDVYTVTSITYDSLGKFVVRFTPQIAAIPAYPSGYIYVQSNLNKIFVRAYLQTPANNTAAPISAGAFNMYYFRQLRSSDNGATGYGIQAYDANGNLTFTSNKRVLELSALGIVSAYTNNNIADPKTGDWYSSNFIFGQTPTNYAIYSPIIGRCLQNWNSSLTPGSGYIRPYTQSSGYGSSHGVAVACRTSAGSSQYTICKVGRQIFGDATYSASPLANRLIVTSNSSVMVINTDKYQP